MTFLRIAFALAAPFALAATLAAQSLEVQLQRAVQREAATGDTKAAIAEYRRIADRAGANKKVGAQALLKLGEAYERVKDAQARAVYEQIVAKYPDQPEIVTTARARLGHQAGIVTGPVSRALWTHDFNPLASLSSDGRLMAYSDRKDVFLRDVGTSTVRNLTNQPPPAEDKAYETVVSPDGTRVAFNWWSLASRRYSIRLANTTGSPNPRLLYENSGDAYDLFLLDWSPDSKTLAVAVNKKDDTVQLGLLSLTDGTLRVLKTLPWRQITTGRFSPDGRYLGYGRSRPPGDSTSEPDVFVIAVDGSFEAPAVPTYGGEAMCDWSPDGKWLLFTRTRAPFVDLWAVAIVNGKPQGSPQRLRANVGSSFAAIGWTPTGALYHQTGSSDGPRLQVRLEHVDLASRRFYSDPLPSRYAELENTKSPQFSPDGRRLAYISEPRGRERLDGNVLVIRDLDKGTTREMRPRQLPVITGVLAWTPDGTALLVNANSVASTTSPMFGNGIYRVDLTAGEASLVVRYDRDRLPLTSGVAWLANGESFLTRAPGPNQVGTTHYRVDSRSGNMTALGIAEGKTSARADVLVPSPDGRFVYYRLLEAQGAKSQGLQGVAVIARELATGSERELLRKTPVGEIFLSHDGRYLATTTTDQASNSRLVILLATAGGQPRELMRATSQGLAIRGWTPDNQSLLVRRDVGRDFQLWLFPIDGQEPQKLDGSLPEPASVTLSADGRRLVYQLVTIPSNIVEVAVLENFLPKSGK
jgi:Tol biopolymer transport system component